MERNEVKTYGISHIEWIEYKIELHESKKSQLWIKSKLSEKMEQRINININMNILQFSHPIPAIVHQITMKKIKWFDHEGKKALNHLHTYTKIQINCEKMY